jgi:protein phosphatase PTC1
MLTPPRGYTSPTQTTTPTSLSDADSPPSANNDQPTPMLKRPGGLSEGPNARSKSVTVAEGDDTYGVSGERRFSSRRIPNLPP